MSNKSPYSEQLWQIKCTYPKDYYIQILDVCDNSKVRWVSKTRFIGGCIAYPDYETTENAQHAIKYTEKDAKCMKNALNRMWNFGDRISIVEISKAIEPCPHSQKIT